MHEASDSALHYLTIFHIPFNRDLEINFLINFLTEIHNSTDPDKINSTCEFDDFYTTSHPLSFVCKNFFNSYQLLNSFV